MTGSLSKDIKFQNLYRYLFISGSVESLAVIGFLLLLPTFATNSWLFGYSISRIVLISAFIVVFSLHVFFTVLINKESAPIITFERLIDRIAKENGIGIPLGFFGVAVILLTAVTVLVVSNQILFDLQPLIMRSSPIIYFIGFRCLDIAVIITIMMINRRKGKETQSQWKSNSIYLRINKIIFFFAAVAFLLVLASLTVTVLDYLQADFQFERIRKLFYLNNERNLPTYFSSVLLFTIALIYGLVWEIKRKRNDRFQKSWLLMSMIFLLLSTDEMVGLHEKVGYFLRKNLTPHPLVQFPWIIVGIPLVALFLILFRKYILQLSPRSRNLFLIGFIVYVGGAIGAEMVGGWYVFYNSSKSFTYELISAVEECMEIYGAIIILAASFKNLQENSEGIQLSIE